MLQVLKFNDVFEAVCEETAPHKLCAYIYEIANEFNKFYMRRRSSPRKTKRNVPVILRSSD